MLEIFIMGLFATSVIAAIIVMVTARVRTGDDLDEMREDGGSSLERGPVGSTRKRA